MSDQVPLSGSEIESLTTRLAAIDEKIYASQTAPSKVHSIANDRGRNATCDRSAGILCTGI
jgi:hypothetical protein